VIFDNNTIKEGEMNNKINSNIIITKNKIIRCARTGGEVLNAVSQTSDQSNASQKLSETLVQLSNLDLVSRLGDLELYRQTGMVGDSSARKNGLQPRQMKTGKKK